MPKSADNPIDSTDSRRGQVTARQGESAIVLLILALFAGGVAICVALMVPILWTAMTEAVQRSTPTYQECRAVKEDTARLACFDRIARQNSLRYLTKDMQRMTFGEILTWRLNRPGRDDSVTQQ
jgi:hypothetical protein